MQPLIMSWAKTAEMVEFDAYGPNRLSLLSDFSNQAAPVLGVFLSGQQLWHAEGGMGGGMALLASMHKHAMPRRVYRHA